MSGTAQPGAYGSARYDAPPGWGPSAGGQDRGGFDPWGFVWSVPKPLLIAAMVVGFIAFWPIGLAFLFFLIGSGRIGGRWARRHGMGARAEMQGGDPGRVLLSRLAAVTGAAAAAHRRAGLLRRGPGARKRAPHHRRR